MSIDYNRLRELVDTSESTDVPLINQVRATAGLQDLAPDMAAELLRLRDELTDLRDTMYAHADLLRGASRQVAADYAHRLTRIMQRDTE